jgi:hypothetical protein
LAHGLLYLFPTFTAAHGVRFVFAAKVGEGEWEVNENGFSKFWLALGLGQLLLAAGCGQAVPSDALLSATANAASTKDLHDAQAQSPNAGDAGVTSNTPQYVRVARSFFDSPLSGSVTVTDANGQASTEKATAIGWQVQAAGPSAAGSGVVADFSDSLGCAVYENIPSVKLCFQLMGDVSSVGLNSREMTAEGLSGALSNPSPGDVGTTARLVSVERTTQGLTADYQLGAYEVRLELSQSI